MARDLPCAAAMTNPTLRPLAGFLLFALGSALVACSGTIAIGDPGTGGQGVDEPPQPPPTCTPSCDGDGGGPSAPPPLTQAIAIPYSSLFPGGAGGGPTCVGGGTGGFGGAPSCPGPDPKTLYLEIGTPSPTCSDPQPPLECGNQYIVSIGIPPALQVPGVIQLSDPTLISTIGETGPAEDGDPNTCPGGGGSFVSGTLTIVAIGKASVTFSLAGTDPVDFGVGSVDGEYLAPRCF